MPTQPEQKASDLELVKRIAQRKPEAFSTFYDRHAPRVFSLLCRLLTERNDAEDMLQETFWQVWRQAGSYDFSRGSPVAWLIQIARSRGIDRLRQIRTQSQRDAGPIQDLQEQLQAQETTDTKTLEQDTKRAVHQALDGLPPEQRQALTLAFFDGLTHPEIAKRLGAPLGTVKTRIRLGMRKLQESLQGMETT